MAIKIRRKASGGGTAKKSTNEVSKMIEIIYVLMGMWVIHRCIHLSKLKLYI